MRALEREVDKRFQTADEFRDALETYLVEERILVPAAGVKGMLRRVLGSKIEQRRQQIRSAIRGLDGAAPAAMLVSDESVVSEDEAIQRQRESRRPAERSQRLEIRVVIVAQPGRGVPPGGTARAGVQTLSQPTFAPPRTNRLVLVGAGIGVVAAGAAFLFFGSRAPEPAVHESTPSAAQAEKTGANRVPKADDDTPEHPVGVKIENLPTDPAAAAAAAAKARDPSAPPPSAATPEQLARDIAAMRVEQKSTEPKPVDPKAVDPKPADSKPEGTAKVTLTDEQEARSGRGHRQGCEPGRRREHSDRTRNRHPRTSTKQPRKRR